MRIETSHTLTLQIETDPRGTVIRALGELDLASVATLASELKKAAASGAERTVLDLTELRFIDSSGLRVLVAAHGHGDDRLVIQGATGQVLRMLEVTGLGSLLEPASQD